VVASTLRIERQRERQAELTSELRHAVRSLQKVLQAAAPGSVSGDEARSLVALFAEAERAASSGIALFTPVVVETGSYTKEGHGSAADWLGALSGSSAGVAKGRLAAAERAASVPEVERALHDGELSAAELKVLTDAAAVAPGAVGTLLPLAAGEASHQELSDAAARLKRAARCAESQRARRDRVHAQRHLTWHQEESGGIRGEFSLDEVTWARVAPRLEAEAKERWKAAGSASGESLAAHRLDAFVALLGERGSTGRGSPGQARAPRTLVLIDAEALRRGVAEGDELCDIDGIGPVSVEAAAELIGQGGVQFLIRDGIDIATVTGTTRVLPDRVQAALIARDRFCPVPGCGKRHGLERDHWQIDFGHDGPTELANLARLCAAHHDLKTHGGWRLEGKPGQWKWVAPAHPPSAGTVARTRRLAAAKATAKRNNPLQT